MTEKQKPLTPSTPVHTTIGAAIAVLVFLVGGYGVYADTSKNIATIEGRVERIETSNKQNNEDIQKIKIDVAEMKKDIKYILKGIDELKKR